MIGQSALRGYSTVCSCGCRPTPKLIWVQDAAAGSDTRGHLCASLPWRWNSLQQLREPVFSSVLHDGTNMSKMALDVCPAPLLVLNIAVREGERLKPWFPDESKSWHFPENSYTATVTSYLKLPLPVPYFLHFRSLEVFLVEQFGLKLCQSVTRLILQPFFMMWVISSVAQSPLLDIQRLEWEAPLFKHCYPLNNMPSYSC